MRDMVEVQWTIYVAHPLITKNAKTTFSRNRKEDRSAMFYRMNHKPEKALVENRLRFEWIKR